MGAPKARLEKNETKIAAQRRFFFRKIAILKRIFGFFSPAARKTNEKYTYIVYVIQSRAEGARKFLRV